MGRIVILEGPDGGGKTTFARELEASGWIYQHDGPPPEGRDNIEYYYHRIEYALSSKRNVVFDRLWLGERIYGSVARGKDTIGLEGQIFFMQLQRIKHIEMKIFIPQMSTSRRNYLEKMKDKEDYLKSMTRWEMVYDKYLNWVYVHGTVGTIHDYEKDDDTWLNSLKSRT